MEKNGQDVSGGGKGVNGWSWVGLIRSVFSCTVSKGETSCMYVHDRALWSE